MEDIKLYSEIEHLIIAWNIDGTKTAGSLTREIMELLNNEGVIQKQQQELLELAYENYTQTKIIKTDGGETHISPIGHYNGMTKEQFINKCKSGFEFSEKWGLKIEEKELSIDERHKLALPIWKEKYGPLADMMIPTNVDNTPYKIPTKLITLTYNNETIESYE